METYPDPRPVPESIPRPGYVPVNFFTAPIWEHDEPKGEPKAGRLTPSEIEKVTRAGKLAAEVLREIGSLVKVCTAVNALMPARYNYQRDRRGGT